MDIEHWQGFFQWCTIINGALLLWSAFWILAAPDLTYRLQNRFYPIARESYDPVMYGFLGLFKILFLVFNLVPYVALTIIR